MCALKGRRALGDFRLQDPRKILFPKAPSSCIVGLTRLSVSRLRAVGMDYKWYLEPLEFGKPRAPLWNSVNPFPAHPTQHRDLQTLLGALARSRASFSCYR